jgi:hypothetical protein
VLEWGTRGYDCRTIETAGPSTALRFGRDDKSYEEWTICLVSLLVLTDFQQYSSGAGGVNEEVEMASGSGLDLV